MAASKVLVWEDPTRIDKAGHLIFPDGQNRGRGSGALDRGQFDREEEALWPDGCAAMYRKEMLDEIGGFDEDFFAYGDDAELGLRARIAGWKCIYTPDAVVRHHRGSTMGKGSARRLALIERNRVLLAAKLFPWSLLWRNPFYFAMRVAASAAMAQRGEGDTAHFPGWRGKLRMAAAIVRGDLAALPLIPKMLRKRAEIARIRKLSPREVRRLILANRLELERRRMSACPDLRQRASATAVLTGSDRLYGTTAREFRVVECGECGLLRLDPPPAARGTRPLLPANYWFAPDSSAASRLEETYRRLVLRDHVRFAARAMRDSGARGPLLDAGCGGGLFLGMMRERGFRVLGPRLFARCRGHRVAAAASAGGLRHARSRALQPGKHWAASPCSTCWSISTTRARIFPPRANCSSPTGRLIVQVPNASSWQFRLLGGAWNGIDVPRHLFDYRGARSGKASRLVRIPRAAAQIFFPARQSRGPRQQPRAVARPDGAPRAAHRREWRHASRERPRLSRAHRGRSAVHAGRSRRAQRIHRHDRGAPPVKYTGIAYRLPRPLRRHILHFECEIEDAVRAFAASLPAGARVLDAGAGEGQYAHEFARQRYCGVDLAVGDAAWNYSRLDAVADLAALPFRDARIRRRAAHRDHRASSRAGGRAARNGAHAQARRVRCCSPRRTNGKCTRRRTIISATRATAWLPAR